VSILDTQMNIIKGNTMTKEELEEVIQKILVSFGISKKG